MEPGKLVWLTNEETGELIDYFGAAEFLMGGDEPLSADMLEEMREAAKMLVINLKPRYMFKPVGLSLGQGGISAEFSAGRSLMLSGKSIQEHLFGAGEAVAGCLTIGEGADHLISMLQHDGYMLKALFADALANAAVERLRVKLEQDVKETLGVSVGWLFGIGYGDLPLDLQRDFLLCMGAEEELGITATEKMILCPSKSVTGSLNLKIEEGEVKEACNGRCSRCSRRETCHIFGGKP